MLDMNSIWWLIGLGFFTSFFATLFANSIGKIIAVIAALPAIIFIISIVSSGMQVHNVQDLNPWITGAINGLIPIIITGIGEAFGAPCGKGLRILLKLN